MPLSWPLLLLRWRRPRHLVGWRGPSTTTVWLVRLALPLLSLLLLSTLLRLSHNHSLGLLLLLSQLLTVCSLLSCVSCRIRSLPASALAVGVAIAICAVSLLSAVVHGDDSTGRGRSGCDRDDEGKGCGRTGIKTKESECGLRVGDGQTRREQRAVRATAASKPPSSITRSPWISITVDESS